MPHTNEFTKTKEGYLIGIEELLGLDENLPKEFYRLNIYAAKELYEATVLSGRAGFEECAGKLEKSIEGIF